MASLCVLCAAPANAEAVKLIVDDGSEALVEALRSALPAENGAETTFEARRQARRAAEAVRAKLNSEGYHTPQIDFAVEPGPPPTPMVRVTAGPQFELSTIEVNFIGERDDPDVFSEARSLHGLKPGDPAVAKRILDGSKGIVRELKDRGYPDAELADRAVRGDRDAETLSVSYDIATGPRVRFGDLIIENEGRTKESYIRKINPVEPGTIYNPATLSELSRRLNEGRLYALATAVLEEEGTVDPETGDEVRDIRVKLIDRARHTVRLGGSFSTAEGVSVRAGIERRNLTGRGDRLSGVLELGTLERNLTVEWIRPNEFGYGYGLSMVTEVTDETTDAFDRQSLRTGVALDITRNPRRTFRLGVEAEVTREEDALGERDLQILSAVGAMRIDESNSSLNPTKGWRADVSVSPTYALGDTSTPYIRSLGQVSAYQPVIGDDRLVLAGRVRMGAVVGAETEDLPVSDRFFAGGGGSVRGYQFQGIGPRDVATNAPIGGRSLMDASLEARIKVRGALGVVGFIDAGSVTDDQYPTADDMRYGAGVGVRYDTAVGPIRFDIATPLDRRPIDDPIQIYISIGQAF